MPVYQIHVKWGKEKFKDIECNTDETPMLFKAQLFALSGVQPERQKVMIKGATLKDDEWSNIKLKDGVTLLMMGTAEDLPKEPVEKTVFVEDMTEQQLATALELPAGLTNLGNTCYMNATLQCLRSMPELKESLLKFSGSLTMDGGMAPDQSVTAAMRDLFESMDKTGGAVPPIIMLNVLHMCFPQFAEKSDNGTFQQQDANECWTELVRCLQRKLHNPDEAAVQSAAAASSGFIDRYMGGQFSISMKCIESEDEPLTQSRESFYQLSCFIEKDVKYLFTGLKSRLEEHITKNSPTLGRDAQYLKTCKIDRLPSYLAIQMVRFYYKEKEAVNAKILKDIKFPMMLDMYDLCSDSLQKKLMPARDRFKEEEDKKAEQLQKAKETGATLAHPSESKSQVAPYWFSEDPGSNNSGYYQLQAVLTHKGRSSSSGHYVAWVRRKGDDWMMFDDANVTAVSSEDILKLSGGGDWHCAYVLLYGPRLLEVTEDREAGSEAAGGATEKPMETSQDP